MPVSLFHNYVFGCSFGLAYALQLVAGLVLTRNYQGTFDGLIVYRRKVDDCKGGKCNIVEERNVQYNGFFVIGLGAQVKFGDCTDDEKCDILNFYIFLSLQILLFMLAVILTASFMFWLDFPRLRKHYYTKCYYPLLVYFIHLGGFLLVVVGGGVLFSWLTVYCMDISLYLYSFMVYLVLVNAAYEGWNKVRKEDGLLTGTVGDFFKVEEEGEEKAKNKVEKGNSKARKGRKGLKGRGKKKWTHT